MSIQKPRNPANIESYHSRSYSTLQKRKHRPGVVLALLALILLSFALRSYRLTYQSLWYDEGVSVRLAHMQISHLLQWTANDIQPPLYYLLLWGWFKTGNPSLPNAVAFWLRFASLFFGVLTVPLLYVITKKLLGEVVAFTAALLMTISPMAVYYSQEGRMYTLLTFVVLLSAYLVVSILHSPHLPKSRQRLWAVLALSMAAAMYIHYFSFFFLTAIYLYFLFVWWKTGRHPLYLIESLAASVGAIVLFSPWLPYLFNRYKVDTSYWGGTLKTPEALRHVFISLSLGETVLESTGTWLMLGFLFLWLLALAMFFFVIVIREQEKIVYPFTLLLLYQIVPLILILLVTYHTPKFAPRYLMPVLPAYLTWLVYASMVPLWSSLSQPGRKFWNAVISLTALGFLLLTMGHSLRNLYFNPAFTKPDFRGAAGYVRSHFEDGEVVVLCSGHMFPVWNVYAADLPQVRIPDIEVLDTSHPLGYGVADTLNRKVAGHKGVWLVLWQNEAVDPNGYLLDFMHRYGESDGKDMNFWHVKVRHFQLDPNVHFSDQPPVQHTLNWNFKGGLSLLGYSQEDMTVTLFWRAHSRQKDFRVSYWIEDRDGVNWGKGKDRRPAAYDFPAFRWPVGAAVFGKFSIPAETGTPPGEYNFCLKAYLPDSETLPVLDKAGAPASDYACFPIVIRKLVKGSLGLSNPSGVFVAPGIKLVSSSEETPGRIAVLTNTPQGMMSEVFQGEFLKINIYWKAVSRIHEDYRIKLSLGSDEAFFPMPRNYPSSRWQPGDVVLTKIRYHIPANAKCGEQVLWVSLVDENGKPAGKKVVLSRLKVRKVHHNFTEIPMRADMEVRFGDSLELVSGDWKQVDGKLIVRLQWKALKEMKWDWTGFVHGLDASGKMVSQDDKQLGANGHPTSWWVPGEVVVETYTLDHPEKIKTLEIGVYQLIPLGPKRLLAFGKDGRELGTSFRIDKASIR